ERDEIGADEPVPVDDRLDERQEGHQQAEPVAPLPLVGDAEAGGDPTGDEQQGDGRQEPAADQREEGVDVEQEHRDLQRLRLRRVGPAPGLHGPSLAAIVLGAGAGTRLRPLTRFRPKVLCPVANVALVDGNLARVAAIVGEGPAHVAVNVHHDGEVIARHVGGRAQVSDEAAETSGALGTAGGVARLRSWLDGRAALVVNGDTWTTIDLAPLVEGWDGSTVRVLVAGAAELRPGART